MRKLPPQIWIGLPAVLLALAVLTFSPYWVWPWVVAAAGYALFISHYQNWHRPLEPAEIDRFLENLTKKRSISDIDAFRAFLEADDGREFFMHNLIKFAEGTVPHPDTGVETEPNKLVQNYSGPFIKALMLRGGHPLVLFQRQGPNIDSWGPTAETGAHWRLTNVMRYRSRRDLLELASDPAFDSIHRFKRDSIAETISSPNSMLMAGFAGPRFLVGLLLALGAAVAEIAILASG